MFKIGMFKTFNTDVILAAASLAVLSAAGISGAAAAPWEVRHDRQEARHDPRLDRRAYVDRIRIADALRLHRYRVIGDPYFVHGRYVVRTHDRFGRLVFVQVDPYSGAFVREVIL